ncbi:MAG: molybdenum cofactor biosynthesis protein MoaE [Planctomycetes bacterium]|nr:molybdenum cofactor biosynthesis protein MoaE [Planctomycetota bacterium]
MFEGIVRAEEDGQRIDALIYTAYEPMATMELTKLAQDVCARHGLARMRVQHSRGRVRIGEVSFRLTIGSPHRKQALAAMDEFIDRMKHDVPIWKAAER